MWIAYRVSIAHIARECADLVRSLEYSAFSLCTYCRCGEADVTSRVSPGRYVEQNVVIMRDEFVVTMV